MSTITSTTATVVFSTDLVLMLDSDGLSLFKQGDKMPAPIGRYAKASDAWAAVDALDLAVPEAVRAAA